MKARVKLYDGHSFVAEAGSGHAVVMDVAPENGGRNMGVRPMEMVLMGLGGCAGIDVVLMLEKSRVKIASCEIELEAERAEQPPSVFTRVVMRFRLQAANLRPETLERAVMLAMEKYCSVAAMIGKTAHIEPVWTIEDAAGAVLHQSTPPQ